MNRFIVAGLAATLVSALAPSQAQDVRAPDPAQAASSAASPSALVSLDIAFIESDLQLPGLAVSKDPDPDFANWHVPDIGRLIQERAPAVLAANGLTGTAILVPAPAPGSEVDLGSVSKGRPVLVLRIATIKKWAPRVFTKAGAVTFSTRLLDGTTNVDKPLWQAQLTGTQLGFDPVFGVLKTNRVDAAWVDDFLAFALESLARANLVRLPGPKALKPKE